MKNCSHKWPLNSFNKASDGFTLLEVLISVLVLTIGLLGFAALQLTAIDTNQSAYFRTQATLIAYDLSSRMHVNRSYLNWDTRANPKTVVNDLNAYVTPLPASNGFACPGVPARICSDQGAALSAICNEQQMAQFDVFKICESANQTLPQGLVHVVCANKPQVIISGQINPRINPYQPSHPIYLNTPDPLIGPDNDACSPGSHYSIAISWLKGQTRVDSGQTELDNNSRCKDDFGIDQNTRDCVAIDFVP